jgi:cell division protease FtsH
MVTQYGMSKRFGLVGLEVQANQYLDNGPVMNCSDATAAEVDQEVIKVLGEAYDEAKRLLSEHRATLDKIAAFLIEKETITGKEFMEIFHEVEGTSASDVQQSSRISERTVETVDTVSAASEPVEAPVASATETSATDTQDASEVVTENSVSEAADTVENLAESSASEAADTAGNSESSEESL